jgi:acyl carrier protein
MTDSIKKNLILIMQELLNTNITEEDNLKRKDTSSWDSLKHLELIFSIEEEFDVRFTAEEVAKMNDLNTIVQMIKDKKL